MLTLRRIGRGAAAILGIGLIHYAFVSANPGLGFVGFLAMAASLAFFPGPALLRPLLLFAAALVVAGAAGYTVAGVRPFVLLGGPLLANLGAMCVFAVTLLPGRVPLITRFSRFDRKQTTGPAVDRYTRMLTALWALYFAAIVIVTLTFAGAGNFVAASWTVTVVSPAGSISFFLLEHLYRRLRHDVFGQASVFRTLRVLANPEAWRGMTHDH